MNDKHPDWILPLAHKNDFVFNSSARDFMVEEIPLYEFSGSGEHLILKVRKKDLTTWQMLDDISSYVGIRRRDIGYAGLKDKHAMTIQYISLPVKYEERIQSFAHDKIKILDIQKHNNKIRVGHLKGNRFKLRLKKVLGIQKEMILSVLEWIEHNGVPNYFGYQRFGIHADNWQEGKKILSGELKIKDRKNREFLISAYQSYLFNNWLSKRVEISRLLEEFSENETENILNLKSGVLKETKKQSNFFKILHGDLMMHYPYGKIFYAQDVISESLRFVQKDISVTGLIPGRRAQIAKESSRSIEELYDMDIAQNGSRRYAWIFPSDIKADYDPQKAHMQLEFFLPKGSYATNIVDMLKGAKING